MDSHPCPARGGPTEIFADYILSMQLAELSRRRAAWTPELRLLAAVLEDAIRTFYRCARSQAVAKQLLFSETAEWFASPDTSFPFAFESICHVLGLDAAAIRERLGLAPHGQTISAPSISTPSHVEPTYDGVLVGIGAFAGCITVGSVALLGTILYHAWALAHVAYF